MDVEQFVNRGVRAIRAKNHHDQRTAVVVGPPRGGTSMVAGALHHLGVYMGEVTGVAFEESQLSSAIENQDRDRVRAIVAERDDEHEVWGWKRPSGFKFLSLIEEEFTNPYYLLVFRDVFGLALRRDISMPGSFELTKTMHNSLGAYGRMVDHVETTSQPCLLLSYEKCLYRPDVAVDAMAEFLGLVSDGRDTAVSFIQRDPPDYLKGSFRTATS